MADDVVNSVCMRCTRLFFYIGEWILDLITEPSSSVLNVWFDSCTLLRHDASRVCGSWSKRITPIYRTPNLMRFWCLSQILNIQLWTNQQKMCDQYDLHFFFLDISETIVHNVTYSWSYDILWHHPGHIYCEDVTIGLFESIQHFMSMIY